MKNIVRSILLICFTALLAFAHLGCHNDQKIIDQHQRMIDDEED